MKTVYKKIAVAITALFVVSLSFLPFAKRVKAEDINDPTYSDAYTVTTINIGQLLTFEDLDTTNSPLYILSPMQIKTYGIKQGASGVDVLHDTFTTYTTNAGVEGVYELPFGQTSNSFVAFTLYSPAKNTSITNYFRYTMNELQVKDEITQVIQGEVSSYTIGPYKSNDLLPHPNGFYVEIKFTNGTKRYNFYIMGLKFTGVTKAITTAVKINSASTVESYLQGKQDGYKTGYNNGYDAGKTDGEKTGYNTGYTAGYNEGRVAPQYSFKEFFIGLGDAFVTIYTSMLNYEFLGINIAGLIGTVVVIVTILIVVKVVLNK